MKQLLTIDLEEWFRNDFPNNDQTLWSKYDDRLNTQITYLLKLLKHCRQSATFFVLGVIARKYPNMIRQIFYSGHEIASHGMYHQKVLNMNEKEFKKDLHDSISILSKIIGRKVYGFRAPYWSINSTVPRWFYDVLKNEKLRYSSSLFPVNMKYYGDQKASRFPQKILAGDKSILEIPCSTTNFFGLRIPFGAGLYFRVYPYYITKKMINNYNLEGYPALIVIHNWELDPDHPRIKIKFPYSYGHYYNLQSVKKKFELLLKDFQFSTIGEYTKKY